MTTLTAIKKASLKRQNFIDTNEKRLKKEVLTLQKDLMNIITEDYIGKFTLDAAGKIAFTEKNIALIAEIDKVFDKWNKIYHFENVDKFGEQLLKLTNFSRDYYVATGFAPKIIDNLEKSFTQINSVIGLDNKGKFIKGGYLDNLLQTTQVRQEVKTFVTTQISSKASLKDFTKGFKDLVVGSKDTTGRLQRYYSQYAYDTFNQTDQVAMNYYAENMDLKYFLYQGSEVDDTREFCKRRHGKVYSREAGESWNSLTWAGQSGNFWTDRGGYNCRHTIDWVSDSFAEDFGITE